MVKFLLPIAKLAHKYVRFEDKWASADIHVPLHMFGQGSVREFDWYFEGTSTVPVADVSTLCEWLAGCEYVSDDELFRQADFWQHPCTFEQLRRGDCEDHAVWAWRKLVEIGLRAELFCGRTIVEGGPGAYSGHAWVVFHDAAGSFLLEPTMKDPAAMVRPLENAKTDYIPHVSVNQHFNRKMFAGALHRARELRQERTRVYSELQGEHILKTIATLETRITERFPGSGLSRVSAELGQLAIEVCALATRLHEPIWLLRIGAVFGILGLMGIILWAIHFGLSAPFGLQDIANLLQASKAAVDEIILLAMVIFFMITLENRVKRRSALKALHRVRSVTHIVDMHQLTKDPGYLFSSSVTTASSPKRNMTRFELTRYLDYCSELLSLTSKVAALFVQHLRDPVVLAAVNDIETLAANLSNKVWQKIMILDTTGLEEVAQRSYGSSYSCSLHSATFQGNSQNTAVDANLSSQRDTGSASQAASDSLPWRARAPRQLKSRDRSEQAAQRP